MARKAKISNQLAIGDLFYFIIFYFLAKQAGNTGYLLKVSFISVLQTDISLLQKSISRTDSDSESCKMLVKQNSSYL